MILQSYWHLKDGCAKMHTLCYNKRMKRFEWNNEKNLRLQKERNISFEEIVYAIGVGQLHSVVKHANEEKYSNQVVLYVEIRDYIYAVPAVETEEAIFLKTAFPDRKATKRILGR